MKNNTINIITVPVASYFNANTDKNIVFKDNRRKSGIYRWNNLITNKTYIGSSISLSRRFSDYYNLNYLKRKLEKGSSAIYSALLKYGHINFSLDILEYCELSELRLKEQYYIDTLKPEYNILKKVGLHLYTKQSKATKQVLSCVFSEDSIDKIKLAAKSLIVKLPVGNKASLFGKTHTVETRTKMSVAKKNSFL
jgi:group I intron endonuclease